MSWLGEPLLESSWSYFGICSWDWWLWRFGRSLSFVWPLSWTRAFWIRVKKNTLRREKYVYLPFLIPFFFLFLFLTSLSDFVFVEMATRYSKEKYARVKGMKNEPLSQMAVETKKRKLNEEKSETTVSPSVRTVPSSPTLSLEMMMFTLPITRSKGKSKAGKSI